MFFEPDPHTGYRPKPGSIGYFQQGIPAIVNSVGHRDDEVTLTKPEGVYRILVLGDSFTVGANVRQEKAYPQVLEAYLNARAEREVEVVNAGVGGWDPYQYAQYYEHYGREFAPDLVLIGFFAGNDTYSQQPEVEPLRTAVLGRRVSQDSAKNPITIIAVYLHEHSHLARLLMQRGPRAVDFTRRNCSDFSEQYLVIQQARMQNHLKRSPERKALVANNSIKMIERIKRLAAKDGTPVVVVLLPDENQINILLQDAILEGDDRASYDFSMPQSLLIELFTELDIPTIDLLPALLGEDSCLYMNDTHWTPEGHRLAAEFIADELIPYLRRID